jgi:molybdopterin-guanine dinucleotide biosynthesis protein A
MTVEALRALGDACADAAWPAGPLPGAYRRTALPALEQCLAQQGSISRACAGLQVARVPLDPQVYADLDTPADLRALQ